MSDRPELPLLILVLIFFFCAWAVGVEFPPKPRQTWWIVIIFQSGLLFYSHQLTRLIWNDVQGARFTFRRRCLAVLIILASLLLLVGYTCCENGQWIGVVTNDQEDMIGATVFAQTLLSFLYFCFTCSS